MDPGGEEATLAVQDEEQFYGDEDDVDELYSDIIVGEGSHLSNIRSEEPAPEAGPSAPPLPLPPPVARVPEKVHVAAVAVEQFYGDEDDFGELYCDIITGEGSHLSNIRSEEPAPEAGPSAPPLPPPLPVARVPEKVHVAAVAEEARMDRPYGVFEQGFRGGGHETAAVAPPPPRPVSVRPELGQNPSPHDDAQGSGSATGGFQRQGGGFVGSVRQGINTDGGGDAGEGGLRGATLFVGDLHWWTTDAQLEEELCQYGQVKEIKFFAEVDNGKSMGYFQVDFYDPMAAAACKDNMNGHLFNDRPCVVAPELPASIQRMCEAQLHRNNNSTAQPPPNATPPMGRGDGVDGDGAIVAPPPRMHLGPMMGRGFNMGRGDGVDSGGGWQQMSGNYGRGGGGSGRGSLDRDGWIGNARNRMGPAGGRGTMGDGAIVAPPPMMQPGPMMGRGFNPTGDGAAMGRMARPFGGFRIGPAAASFHIGPAAAPFRIGPAAASFPIGPAAAPFPGTMPSFPPGVNPHMIPAFFGREGMPAAVGGVGMWPDPNLGGWTGGEQWSYEDDAAFYGEANYGRGRASGRRHEGMAGRGQEFSGWHYDDRELSRGRWRGRGRTRDRERYDRGMHSDHHHHLHRDHPDDRDRERYDRGMPSDHHHHRHRDHPVDRDGAGG